MFGKINLSEVKKSNLSNKLNILANLTSSGQSSSLLTNDNIDTLIDIYLTNLRNPFDLIVQTIDRSRDRLQREYSKLEAH